MCACALDRLEDKVDEGTAASSYTYPKSIWQQCTPRSDRSPTTKNRQKITSVGAQKPNVFGIHMVECVQFVVRTI